MRWCSWIIWTLPAALQLCETTALAADMPQEVVGSWSQQKTCSNAVEFDQKGYTTFIDGKGHRCDVARVAALKSQFPTTLAWGLELSCGFKFSGGQRLIYSVVRIHLDNAPHVMALAEIDNSGVRGLHRPYLAIYFRCR